jgi:hypothetical protein
MSNIELLINKDENCTCLTISDGDKTGVIKDFEYNGLSKWQTLIERLDREYGTHAIKGEDTKYYSYKTFTYDNGVRVHTEPYEFLIDVKHSEMISQIKTIVQSVGYDVRHVDFKGKRIHVSIPF